MKKKNNADRIGVGGWKGHVVYKKKLNTDGRSALYLIKAAGLT